jgi:hypothetical protein
LIETKEEECIDTTTRKLKRRELPCNKGDTIGSKNTSNSPTRLGLRVHQYYYEKMK